MRHALRKSALGPLLFIAILLAHPSGAQNPESSLQKRAEKPTVLRVTSRLVQVNVVVADKGGQPVAGLDAKDFRLEDEGEEQEISVFVASSSEAPLLRPVARTRTVFTNRPYRETAAHSPNLHIVLFDGLNSKVTDQTYARQQVVRFLQSVRQNDLVAIYVLGNGLRIVHDFSKDFESLRKTTEQLSVDVNRRFDTDGPDMGTSEVALFAEFASSAEKRVEAALVQNRVMTTLNALEAVANHVAGIPGRKNLIWVSAAFPLAIGIRNPENNWARLDTIRGFSTETDRVMRAMNRANVAIYPIDSRGFEAIITEKSKLPTASTATEGGGPLLQMGRGGGGRGGRGGGSASSQSSSNSLATGSTGDVPTGSAASPFNADEFAATHGAMRLIADQTGGRAFFNTNDLSGAIRTAMDESAFAYTLGYYPKHGKWDGTYREIKVRVNRPNLHVRFRRGYTASEAAPVEEKQSKETLQAAIGERLQAAAIGMSAEFAPIPGNESQWLLRLRVNARDIQLADAKDVYSGAADLLLNIVEGKDSVTWRSGQRFTLNLKRETYQRVLRDGLLFRVNVPRAGEAARLLIGVSDAHTGAVGTLQIPCGDIRKALDTRNP
jgi:VWFA-related protein